jgi:hypothetical protein
VRREASPWETEQALRMDAYFRARSDGIATDHVLCLADRAARPVEAVLDEHLAIMRTKD